MRVELVSRFASDSHAMPCFTGIVTRLGRRSCQDARQERLGNQRGHRVHTEDTEDSEERKSGGACPSLRSGRQPKASLGATTLRPRFSSVSSAFAFSSVSSVVPTRSLV